MNKLTILLVLIMAHLSNSNAFISIGTEKKEYLQNEPVYLEILYNDGGVPENFYISGLQDDAARIGLNIIKPNGEVLEYTPPVRLEYFGNGMKCFKYYETIIITKGTVVTSEAGNYEMFIVDKLTGEHISNHISISVIRPSTSDDLTIERIIDKNPVQYAYFVYLNGGDQFEVGKEIIDELSIRESRIKGIARTISAINYSRVKYDWVNKKVQRDKDIKKVESFFPKETDRDIFVPKSLQMEVCCAIRNSFGNNISKDLEEEIDAIILKNKNDITKSSYKKLLKQK